jgi:uncharacterized protein (TIGR02118 family)
VPHFVALWTKPETDVEGFEEHYRTTHTEIVHRWAGFKSVQTIRTPRSPFGDPAYHLVTIIELEDLGEGLNSEAAKEALDDAKQLQEKHGTTMTVLTGDAL